VHVTETCDDDTANVITDVETCPAMQPDMASTAGIHQRLAGKGLPPGEHFVDSAYVDAALLVSSRREHGISLEGPIRTASSWQARAKQGYEQRDFTVDWEQERVICRQGVGDLERRAG
jgi:transposase